MDKNSQLKHFLEKHDNILENWVNEAKERQEMKHSKKKQPEKHYTILENWVNEGKGRQEIKQSKNKQTSNYVLSLDDINSFQPFKCKYCAYRLESF